MFLFHLLLPQKSCKCGGASASIYMGLCAPDPITGLCSPNLHLLSCEKKVGKDSLGEVSPNTPLPLCCHRCTLLQDRKVIKYPLWICSPKSFSKKDTYKITDFLLRYTDGSTKRGSREGEGVFPLSAGSLETRGFALCGVKLCLTPTFFAQESPCGSGAHSPIKKGVEHSPKKLRAHSPKRIKKQPKLPT